MIDWLDDSSVAVTRDAPRYAATPPYPPSERYPEWSGLVVNGEDNPAYRSVRELFHRLGYDSERYGTADWNPLSDLIRRNDNVVIKPNLVAHRNLGFKHGLTDTDSLITHGSVIRAVLDYVGKALSGTGRVIVGDCPIQGTRWDQVVARAGLDAIARDFRGRFPGVTLQVRDYRLGRARIEDGRVVERIVDESDRDNYLEVDIARDSALMPLMTGEYSFGVAAYPKHRMRRAHSPTVNQYLMPRDFLEADVMLNLPKMKVHCKAGITCALKNFVGINGHKDYLPHFRFGSPKQGGDEYPDGTAIYDLAFWLAHRDWELEGGPRKRAYHVVQRLVGKLVHLSGYPKDFGKEGAGGWHGNDTIWRMILDINRVFFYLDSSLRQTQSEPRDVRYLAILDGLVGGQGHAPLAPTPIRSGFMVAARNPLALDTAAAALMGLDIERLRQLVGGYALARLPLARFSADDVRLRMDEGENTVADVYAKGLYLPFEPSRGYRGHIEYVPSA